MMRRDTAELAARSYDVVVVGGGIYGACIAWDATLRGLQVALVERDDFGGATSANSLRIVHGGLRYLARGAAARMRESTRERTAFLRIAPALVEPLPVAIPTTGWGTQSRAALGAAVLLNDLCSPGRNRGLAPERRLPRGRLLSLEACRRLFPAFPAVGASGGALWYDARLRHPERLTLAFVRSAAWRGAMVANYCRMDRVLSAGGKACGVGATDVLTGRSLEIRGTSVVIAAGPWTAALAGPPHPGTPQAFALNLVVGRRLAEAAIGVRAPTGQDEDPIVGGQRFVFLAPQAERTLLGTWYAPAEADVGALLRRGTETLLREFRESCPGLELRMSDVVQRQWGHLPLKAGLEPGRPDSLADQPRIVDHGRRGGMAGMFSVEGVKYTTARRVAETVVNHVVVATGARAEPCRTAEVRVDQDESEAQAPDERVRRAVTQEMAVRLSDVVLRRVWSGIPDAPVADAVTAAARAAGAELGWSHTQREAQVEDVMRQLRIHDAPSGSPA
jgi:glycerol-3-phosphate dehydrogenase